MQTVITPTHNGLHQCIDSHTRIFLLWLPLFLCEHLLSSCSENKHTKDNYEALL